MTLFVAQSVLDSGALIRVTDIRQRIPIGHIPEEIEDVGVLGFDRRRALGKVANAQRTVRGRRRVWRGRQTQKKKDRLTSMSPSVIMYAVSEASV